MLLLILLFLILCDPLHLHCISATDRLQLGVVLVFTLFLLIMKRRSHMVILSCSCNTATRLCFIDNLKFYIKHTLLMVMNIMSFVQTGCLSKFCTSNNNTVGIILIVSSHRNRPDMTLIVNNKN